LTETKSVKVSIVITNYNLGKYLPEAVQSAHTELNRLGPGTNSEIIIVDDASTEPLPSAIERDASLHIIKNPKNLYLAGALNVGVGAARGKYVLLLDADNRVKNLDLLVDALDKDPSLDIAYGKMQVFGDAHARAWISDWPPKEADHLKQLQHNNQITSTALYRRKLWKWAGAYRDRCRLGEDADFWLRCLALGAKARRVTDLVTLEYRDRLDSVSHQNKDWAWNAWYTWTAGQFRLSGVGGPIFIHDQPKVSVIIPVGSGHERLVIDAIDSVQAQSGSFWDWECIVVNDTDRPLKYIPSWARVIPGGQKGASHARNRGMALSKGEYVLFLDADDYLHPEALYHLYNTLVTSNCQNVFVYSDWFEAENGKHHESGDFNPKIIFDKLANPVSALYKKWDLTKNTVRWDESFVDGWEDWDFAIQVAAKAGLCGIRLRAPLLHYRLKSGFLRKNAKAHGDEIKLKVKHKWADYISGEKPNRSESMGCGGCGGGRYPSILSNVTSTGPFEGVDIEKDTSLVEYLPPPDWTGTRSFVGRVTGNRYRFSTTPEGRVRRVYNVDVPGLVQLGYFRVATTNGVDAGAVTPLAAPGPPVDEVGGSGDGAAA
jgi:glycosyltransferase involved in cell wall biosynthesis